MKPEIARIAYADRYEIVARTEEEEVLLWSGESRDDGTAVESGLLDCLGYDANLAHACQTVRMHYADGWQPAGIALIRFGE